MLQDLEKEMEDKLLSGELGLVLITKVFFKDEKTNNILMYGSGAQVKDISLLEKGFDFLKLSINILLRNICRKGKDGESREIVLSENLKLGLLKYYDDKETHHQTTKIR